MKKVWRDLTAKKMRTFLVVLSIAVGVMAISTVFGTKSILLPRIEEAEAASNPTDIAFFTNGVSAETLSQIAQYPDVISAEGSSRRSAQWQVNGKWESMRIHINENVLSRTVSHVELIEGHVPAEGEILLERLVTDVTDVAVGDDITIKTSIGEHTLKVAGFVYDINQGSPKINGFSPAYLDPVSAEAILGNVDISIIRLKVADETQIEALTETLEKQLTEQHNTQVTGSYSRDIVQSNGSEMIQALLAIMGGIGILALLLTVFLVINTISTILASEIPNIGTMKAIGGTRGMVVRAYLLMVLGYGVLGSLLGLILGIIGLNLLTKFIADLINIRLTGFAVPPVALGLGVLIGLVLPLIAAFFPVWKATGITVREAMVSYGIGGKTGRIEQWLSKITALPFGVLLSLRNLFRSKGRTFLTLLTLTLAGVTFVAVQSTSTSLDKMMDVMFKTYDADLGVGVRAPIEREQLMALVDDVEGVDSAEAWNSAIDNSQDPALRLNGIPYNSRLYAYQDILLEGRWLEAGESNTILISGQIAKNFDYSVGDQITTEINGADQTWEIIGIVDDFNWDGRQMVTSYEQLAVVLDMPNLTDSLMIRFNDRNHDNIDTQYELLSKSLAAHSLKGGINVMYKNEDQARNNFGLLVTFLLVMVVLVSVVGALGLLGTLTINVTERIKEVGVMRSVGADSRSITQIFWLEGVLLGVMAWLLAVLIGYPIARSFTAILSDTMELPMSFSMQPVTLLWLGVGLIAITSIASVFPALSAARKRVADIIRYA